MMLAGVRPTIRLASAPIARTRLVLASIATTRRLADDDAAVADVDERVGGPEVDPDVAGEEAEDPVEHLWGRSFLAVSRRGPRRAGLGGRRVRAGSAGKPVQYTRPRADLARRQGPRARRRRPEPGSVEGNAPVAQRDVGVVADDEVVEQVDVEQATRRQGLGGEMEIVRLRRRIADGWLWTRIRPLALRRTASRNSSPTRTRVDDTLPW